MAKKDKNEQVLDTIVNFTKVDTSPSFKVCKNLLDEEKTNCFRGNIHRQITKCLQKSELSFEDVTPFEITVVLHINNNGDVSLKDILYADDYENEVIVLKKEIKKAIAKIPKLNPALKRGIPVTTEYKLPIKIQTED